jgi:hypothetical protein
VVSVKSSTCKLILQLKRKQKNKKKGENVDINALQYYLKACFNSSTCNRSDSTKSSFVALIYLVSRTRVVYIVSAAKNIVSQVESPVIEGIGRQTLNFKTNKMTENIWIYRQRGCL